MIDISISKVSKTYGFDYVLKNITFDIHKGDRVALIGENGCGKSSLLNIICGIESVSDGNISIRKGVSIGYLEQNINIADMNIKVKDLLYESVKEITDIENKLREYEKKMLGITDNELEKVLKKYGNLQEKFITMGGYEVSQKIGKIVTGFKIERLLDSYFNTLSGGEKRIVLLAKIMINNPDILILDEPTNHLDIETLEWFENYLNNYDGTVLIVSHDRYFLDSVVKKIILIENGNSEIFFGNYSYYIVENEKRIMKEFADYNDQKKQIDAMKKKIKKLQEFGKLAGIAGGEMFFKRAASIQKRLDKIMVLDKPSVKKEIPLDFKFDKRSGKEVLKISNYSKQFGDKLLFKEVNAKIRYMDKIALIGKNGSGKSTLVKDIINGNDNMVLGSNVKLGYIPQDIIFDNPNDTILDYARGCFIGLEHELRATLSKFLFYYNDVFKKIGSLSGGERVRLKLFELIQKKANFLILDEPTNHIDISTKELLEEALTEYNGTLLFISHDRYFINKLANKVLAIENNELVEYVGNYDDYKKYGNFVKKDI